jgi:hypothetical protein
MARKVFDDTHISASANRIRYYLSTTDTYTTSEMPKAIDKVYSTAYNAGETYGREKGYEEGYEFGKDAGMTEGEQAERDKFWEKFQQRGLRTNYRYAFYNWHWNNTIYQPKYPITCSAVSSEMMRYSEISDTVVPITITHTNSQYCFANNTKLTTIVELNVNADVQFIGWFAGCTALANITFGEGSVIGQSIDFSACPLTMESVANIAAHLGTVTNKTLTLGDSIGQLASDTMAEILEKGWTIA